jgi:DNA polymerase-3 subunit alpha
MASAEFTHLHVHSQYSLLDGAIRIPDLIARAKEYGMNSVAITDHGNLFGAMDFYEQVQAAGIRPIIGCEVYVAPGSRFDRVSKPNEPSAYHLILLCENEKGYRNLCRLVTDAYFEGFYYKPRIDHELLEKHNEGLICLSGCLSGEVASALLTGSIDRAVGIAEWYREVFSPERYYLELQENGLEEQRRANRGLIEIAKRLELNVTATNDCHYLDRTDHKAHEVLLGIQTGKTLNDDGRLRFETEEFYFKSPKEMAHDFKDIPEALRNTQVIAEKCSLLLQFDQIFMPRFDLGTGETLRERFEKDARTGFDRRIEKLRSTGDFEESSADEYTERLEREIKLIQEMGFAGYFLIVADFINYAKDNGIPVGPGRGSAAGSLAAYSLGITDIDPIRYDLLFERFLNPERKSMPDIDVDFCMDGRDRVIEYVSRKYGKENVAQIITFGRMQAKAVIRDVARVMGLPYSDGDRIAKLVPDELKITLKAALEKEPRLKAEMEADAVIQELIQTAQALEGITRHASTHAAGIVISDRPLVEHLPLYKGNKDETLTQFDMNIVEKIGLVKFDFLGLKTLTVIDQALKLIEYSCGARPDLDAIPLNDEETYTLLSRGDTMGVFQLESSGMRDILTKFKPSVFEDLIAILALYRPGPLESGMVDDFINRKHGRTKIEYPLPELEPILNETYGVIVYQEQVMNIATTLASYSLGDADLLRRAMGKKKPEVMAEQKARFEKGAGKNKIDPEKAAYIFDLMEKFAGYGFNKSHSTAYAMVTYQTAYLKTHYPAEFMAAQLSCDAGNTDKVTAYIAECREKAIEVMPPHVNRSFSDFHVEEGKIIFGLSAVKNVGAGPIASILEQREKDGLFCNLDDFATRVDLRKVNKKVLESLIKCGAFDDLGHTRRAMLDGLEMVLDHASAVQRERDAGQFNLFDTECLAPGAASASSVPELVEWDEALKLGFEKDVLGFYVSGHPMQKYEDILTKFITATSKTLAEIADSRVVRLAGLVKNCKEINTKRGERMAFLTLEDLTGTVEVTVFADVYAETQELIKSGDPIVVSGPKEGNAENPKVLAQEIFHISEAKSRMSNEVRITLSSRRSDPSHVALLKGILSRHKGRVPVTFEVIIPNRTTTVIKVPTLRCDASDSLFTEVKQALGYQPMSFQ